MAELFWKGKQPHTPLSSQRAEQYPLSESSFQLHTVQYYAPEKAQPLPTVPAHAENWYNRLIFGDKSQFLPALCSQFTGKVDLIYIDPPFMTGRTFNSGKQVAYSDIWKNDLDLYLQWLYETLRYLYMLLAQTGSLYIHLDWRTIHYAKLLLDEIFGGSVDGDGPGFKNEIIWHYHSGGRSQRYYPRKHDTLLLYTKSERYCFHGERIGKRRGREKRNHMRKEVTPEGRVLWTIRTAGRVYSYDEDTLMPLSDVWSDISHLHQKDPERVGYATQKPTALLERVILASSEKDDLVLDCFCGSGVTPDTAERLQRRWLACDKSELAITLTQQRLLSQQQHTAFALQHVKAGKSV